MTDALRKAAQAVLDRWDSPQWEWSTQGPTADLMQALRAALAQPAASGEPPKLLLPTMIENFIMAIATQAVASPDASVPKLLRTLGYVPAASGEPVADPHAYSRRCAAAELERGPWGKHAAQPAPARVNEGAKGGV